jgi:hypothetical protein
MTAPSSRHGSWPSSEPASPPDLARTPHPVWLADDHDVPSAIVDEANKSNVDLVVLGARGLAGVRALLGSVSNHVLQHSRRPVLVIPARSTSEDKGNPEPPAGVAASAEDA